MVQSLPCCREPQTLTEAKSPFAKIIALGFYDGPTSGVLQCATCQAVYKFDLLDWDEDHEVRIFRLAGLPPNSLARCVAALHQPEEPRWPIWVPSRWTLPSEEARAASDREVQHLLDLAKPAELVVAWDGSGPTILAARRVPAKELNEAPDWFSLEDSNQARDWFSLLGLVKGSKVGCPPARA